MTRVAHVGGSQPRDRGHRSWVCPTCAKRHDLALPARAVTCGEHKGKPSDCKPVR